MMHFGYANGLIGLGLGCIFMLVIVVLAVLAIVALIRYLRGAGRHDAGHNFSGPNNVAGPNPALRILDERYAKGEISDDEYKAKKAELLK